VVEGGEPAPGGDTGHYRVYGCLGLLIDVYVVDPSALDTDQVVVMLLQRLGQLISGDAIATMMRGSDGCPRQDGQSAIDGGERDCAVEVGVDLCCRHRASCPGQRLDDGAPARREPDFVLTEAIGDKIEDLRDGGLPSTLGPY